MKNRKFQPETREEYLAYRAGVRHTRRIVIREINRSLQNALFAGARGKLEELRDFIIQNSKEPELPKKLRKKKRIEKSANGGILRGVLLDEAICECCGVKASSNGPPFSECKVSATRVHHWGLQYKPLS